MYEETEAVRADNFGAGPAALPVAVLRQVQEEFIAYRQTGMSVVELGHRTAEYSEIQNQAKQRLRRLLGISEDFEVLFLQGGASLQFAMVPLNFLDDNQTAAYALTGSWAKKAYQEGKLVGRVRVASDGANEGYRHIPKLEELLLEPEDAYLHLTSNNTIVGSQWADFPVDTGVPLVADMSSDILSRPVPVERFQLIYAGAQKNLGPAGLTIVILRKSWLEQAVAKRVIPSMLRYDTHVKGDSRYNTPPVFPIYVAGLVLQWLEEQGGLVAMARRNQEKAAVVYQAIDEGDNFYTGVVDVDSRSPMNITFRLPTEELEKQFVQEAKVAGMVGLGGHRSVGGCRASLYNAVTLESCTRLAEFMADFRKIHG
ncbi:3-phosphoserine/phosphohydroxythreonine transaminase [Alicyclobacillaceae bacterium I2511]|nr:3-phosphoserine/phosphohydroxythreonine transaminase [Alicyclobacillaceae bacterium I2511]